MVHIGGPPRPTVLPMEPIDIGNAGLGMQGAGAVFGALGAFFAASSNQSMLRGQAEIAEINARTEEGNAQARLFAGQREEQRSLLATAGLKSKQKVAFAANGIDLGEGSAVRTLTDTDVMGAIDANQIKANAVREAWGYRVRATNFQNEALMKRASASAINPLLSATTSLLGSAGQVASSYYQLNKTGVFGNGSGDFSRMGRAAPAASATYWD